MSKSIEQQTKTIADITIELDNTRKAKEASEAKLAHLEKQIKYVDVIIVSFKFVAHFSLFM